MGEKDQVPLFAVRREITGPIKIEVLMEVAFQGLVFEMDICSLTIFTKPFKLKCSYLQCQIFAVFFLIVLKYICNLLKCFL